MPPPSTSTALPYIANTIAAIALIPTISGAAFLFYPAAGLQQMRLTSSDKTATRSEIGLCRMYAVRQCAMGEWLAPFQIIVEVCMGKGR